MLLSGLQGYVSFNGQLIGFKSWKMPVKVVKPKVNSFKYPFQRVVSGLPGASIDVEGPWDTGNMGGIAAGGTYTVLLGVTASVFLSVTAVVDWEASNDVEDAPRLRVSGDSDGAFSLVIL